MLNPPSDALCPPQLALAMHRPDPRPPSLYNALSPAPPPPFPPRTPSSHHHMSFPPDPTHNTTTILPKDTTTHPRTPCPCVPHPIPCPRPHPQLPPPGSTPVTLKCSAPLYSCPNLFPSPSTPTSPTHPRTPCPPGPTPPTTTILPQHTTTYPRTPCPPGCSAASLWNAAATCTQLTMDPSGGDTMHACSTSSLHAALMERVR